MRKAVIPTIFFVLVCGCLDNNQDQESPLEGATKPVGEEPPHPSSPPFNFSNGRNLTAEEREMLRKNVSGRSRRPNWSGMEDHFLQIKEKLGLPENASEEDVRKALEKMEGDPPRRPVSR